MPDDKEYPNGLYVKAPSPKAPDFVKGSISINIENFLEYLAKKSESGEEWLRLDIKEGFNIDERTGQKKWHSSVNNWKPAQPKVEGSTEGSNADPF
tara:strand:- start:4515 stop:4802 length:288 start_codon:yes stop_codon:yes gene_type:complete